MYVCMHVFLSMLLIMMSSLSWMRKDVKHDWQLAPIGCRSCGRRLLIDFVKIACQILRSEIGKDAILL